ncbi:MAG: twin-arginine translocase subunit TatC [Calditrichales bacterium]|nr:MAG: twin-arginine translocase subunit TatC [Calditrichales bacterium]
MKILEKEMPFLDHLEELRWRLLKSIISVFIMMVICFYFSDYILDMLLYPGKHIDPPVPLQVLKVQTVFIIKLEIALFAGIVLSLPVIFYQLWQFLAPGLLKKERKLIPVMVFASVLCFLVGAAFAYLIIIPYALQFFLNLAPPNIQNNIALDFYIGFLLRLIIVFGIVFEMPMLSFLLTKFGLLTPQFMRQYRKYAIVGAFIVGAILTPPDPTSQVLLAIPMIILYEISIFISSFFTPRKVPTD